MENKIENNLTGRIELAKKRNKLEDFLGKNCGVLIPNEHMSTSTKRKREKRVIVFNNNNYLIENLIIRSDKIYDLIDNPKYIEYQLAKKLSQIPHTYRTDKNNNSPYQYTESRDNIYRLSPSQILRVGVLMKTLEKQDFRNHIGSLIEEDMNDPYTEHGGLVIFDNKKILRLINVESELAKEKDPKNASKYLFPQEAKRTPNIARYHIHALYEDSSRYAGPSQGDVEKGRGDLAVAIYEAMNINEAHNLVITKLLGQKFNIDYYCCEEWINKDDIFPIPTYDHVVLDLGNYEYEK